MSKTEFWLTLCIGKQAGRGKKGQGQRSGLPRTSTGVKFEGGQTPVRSFPFPFFISSSFTNIISTLLPMGFVDLTIRRPKSIHL